MECGERVNLRKALRLDSPKTVAFVGAGGKTTGIFRLAKELPCPVIVTTTTHMGVWQVHQGDRWIVGFPKAEQLKQMASGVTVITGAPDENDRVSGLSNDQIEALHDIVTQNNWSMLIEADGARQLPLKAPGENEPVIHKWVDVVVVVAGMSSLGQPCDNAHIHHPDHFCHVTGLGYGERVGEEHLLLMLQSKMGGLKNIPSTARRIVLLNQINNADRASAAARIAEKLLPTYNAILVGNLASTDENDEVAIVREPIAGVILAAGGASRYGADKVNLIWRGKSFIENIVSTGLNASLAQIVVIINNAYSHNINNLPSKNIIYLQNNKWEEGQSTSIRLGIQAVASENGGAIFFLGDQPQIPDTLIRELIHRHACTHAPIVAPFVDGRRGNPVLFDKCTFAELAQLKGDVGGRELFKRYPVEYVPWHDASILLDVDTPEDYARLLELE